MDFLLSVEIKLLTLYIESFSFIFNFAEICIMSLVSCKLYILNPFKYFITLFNLGASC